MYKLLKGKELVTCVIPACIYGLVTVAISGAHQQRPKCAKIIGCKGSRGLNEWI